jgi:hypothetical protein
MPKTESGRAKTLIKKIDKELSTIPDYKFGKKGAGFAAMSDAVTALRRGIRALKGKESKESLVKKRERMQSLIKEAEEYKGAEVIKGTRTILLK